MSDLPQENLDAAIQRYTKDSGMDGAGIISQYVLVLHQVRYDEDGSLSESVNYTFLGGECPTPSAIGIMQIATDILRGVTKKWRKREGEEEEE